MRSWKVLGAVGVALALGCSGLGGPVRESDEVLGRGNLAIPVPSTAVLTGFDDDTHRARVEDALCQGEVAVWGELAQAVATSLGKGENHADVTARYTSLVEGCEDRGYCGWARGKVPNTDGEIQWFWLSVLATCGDLQDRPHYRDLDAEARQVATFYTLGSLAPHREPADDGALIVATERLLQRGGLDDTIKAALWSLLRLDHPEAAETLAPLVPIATLDAKDELLRGLAGQSAPAAIAAIAAACAETPDKDGVCGVEPKGPFPGHDDRWLAELAATADPDRAQALLDAHPELHDAARAHLASCAEACARPASLLTGDGAVLARLDELGVTPRTDRADRPAFSDSTASALEGRGRLLRVDPAAKLTNDALLRRLARLADLDPYGVWFHDLVRADGATVAVVETPDHHWEIAAGPSDLDACLTLLNHVLGALDRDVRLAEWRPEGSTRLVVAVPPAALDAFRAEGWLVDTTR